MTIFYKVRDWLVLLSVAVLMLSSQPANARVGSVANPRYAALVIDADTGNVLFARYANEKRYPASLTKMMTLYLLFEALHQGKVTMETMLPVSRRAASMPQTNLFLRAGDSLSVRDAIRALVIRSANDVAVVIAEYLGGSESNFGVKMTQKARQLGMNNSFFRNASGLPDLNQHTTARDLAVLAMALKKHFPKYYPFFNIKDFSFRGRNYHTHNRVVERLSGAEGMKTGYINMSGFNLVTTVNRSGKNLVGVVLGGRTAATRDNHMIQLIEQAYKDLQNNNSGNAYASNAAPVASAPVMPKVVRGVFSSNTSSRQNARVVRPPIPASKPQALLARNNQSQPIKQNTQPAESPPALVPSKPQPLPFAVVNAQAAPVSQIWGIQVGAYSQMREAEQAVMRAAQLLQAEVAGGKMMITNSAAQTGIPLHRARLANLSEQQARKACQKLISLQQSCFVVRVD